MRLTLILSCYFLLQSIMYSQVNFRLNRHLIKLKPGSSLNADKNAKGEIYLLSRHFEWYPDSLKRHENRAPLLLSMVLELQAEADVRYLDTMPNREYAAEKFQFLRDLSLAFDGKRFGLIDLKKTPKIEFKYDFALPFDKDSFAHVSRDNKKYLIDEKGTEHLVAYNIRELNPELRALDLRGQNLEKLPSALFELGHLEILLLDENRLKEIPAAIGQLKNLKILALRKNQLQNCPTELFKLDRLEKLDLTENKFLDKVSLFKQIKIANRPVILSAYEFSEISAGSKAISIKLPIDDRVRAEIFEIDNLITLDLSTEVELEFVSMDVTMEDVANDESLVISNKDYFKKLSNLKKLTTLSLSNRNIDKLPMVITELEQLTHLDLGLNNLTSLPLQFGQLEQLEALMLNSNNFGTFPKALSALKKLQALNLKYNGLKVLPSEIAALENLQELNLSGNKLKTLPAEVGGLVRLQSLNCRDNIVEELPIEIGALKKLRKLNLGQNKLETLPNEIGRLSELVSLNIQSNNLLNIPFEISQLSKLIHLDLSHNQIGELNPKIFELTNLQTLNLSRNPFSRIPKEIGQLKSLKSLDLSSLKLKEFPLELGQLSSLTDLNLWGLRIDSGDYQSLIEALSMLENLYFLELGSMPIDFVDYIQLRKKIPWCTIDWVPPHAQTYFREGNYEKAFEVQQYEILMDSSIYNHYFSLSYYALFVGGYDLAIEAVNKTLALEPKALSVETNLALAYLLSNQWEKAKAIYEKWKDKNWPNGRSCNVSFLKDIEDLETAGISHPDFAKVRQIIEN